MKNRKKKCEKVDIGGMAGIQKSVRWEPWVERVIWEIAEAKGKNFSWTANYLMEVKLNDLGFYREDYEPDMKDIMSPKKKSKEKKEA
jgi:hypothetical protein